MKQTKLLKLLFLLALILSASFHTLAFDVDGIHYSILTDNQVEVTYVMYFEQTGYLSDYSGDIIVPDEVIYEGISYSVVGIGDHSFYHCTRLTSVTIPNSVYYIGDRAFAGCTALTCINLPNSINSIREGAFTGCSGLTEIIIPNSISFIHKDAFWNCSGLTKVHISSLESWCNINFDIYSNPLVYAHHLYLNGTEITDLVIPNTISNIGERAFQNCMGLTSVIIPDSAISIGFAAFNNCAGLTSATIGKSVNTIGNYAFEGCTSLSTLNYNAISCTDFSSTADERPFKNLNISNIYIGDSVQKIPAFFAAGLKELTRVNIGNNVKVISEGAFSDCSGLTDIIIPNSVTIIGDYAFDGCIGLTNVTIPEPVTRIGRFAFSNCTEMNRITFEKNPNYIGYNAFQGCTGLTEVHISSLKAWCDIVFLSTSGYSPESSFSNPLCYAHHLFLNEEEVKHLLIPDSVSTIRENTFRGCTEFLSIIIPISVTRIENNAFLDCTKLNFVISFNTRPPSAGNNIFPSNQLVFVPDAFYYTQSSNWKNYNIQEFYNIEPQFTKAIVTSNNNEFITLVKAVLKDHDGQPINTFTANDNTLVLTGLMPNPITPPPYFNQSLTISIVIDDNEYEIKDNFETKRLSFTELSSTSITQTTLTLTFTIGRDDGLLLDACGVECSSDNYLGIIKGTTDDSYIIECFISGLTPSRDYSLRPWIQYNGVKYYGYYNTLRTASIEVNENVTVTPTSVYLAGSYSSPGDAVVKDSYFTFDDERMKDLYLTGLNPNTSYNYTYTIETTSGNQVTNNSFRTTSLTMVAQPVKMLTNTTVMFEAQTNMIDEETMVGFEWRRYDAPEEMPSATVYSPVFGGKIAGTLKNLAENVYYKYRPLYTSKSGKSYYGDWVAFLTADAGVVYEPIVYTYNSPALTQTEAILQGVVLQGSEEITEQGFEYWKSDDNTVTKVIATGERMSKKVSGLQSNAKYVFRAFLTAGGETHYGNEIEFITLSNNLDVNLDGEINIADINMIIGVILSGESGQTGDANSDGEVNIADINAVIESILSN